MGWPGPRCPGGGPPSAAGRARRLAIATATGAGTPLISVTAQATTTSGPRTTIQPPSQASSRASGVPGSRPNAARQDAMVSIRASAAASVSRGRSPSRWRSARRAPSSGALSPRKAPTACHRHATGWAARTVSSKPSSGP